ncbi:hypothetical protein RchiOBHm_Chr3g0497541 [Rosa chinensis]|uniref:Uncharacterized protein n=1 Tax=Rosa chinensis TaxID=74649 RepID=A0A2P6RHT4_ROSCH|nr:hypothetical protein RchiOBHm_Chr3g0497541 [Rosa chinensis]
MSVIAVEAARSWVLPGATAMASGDKEGVDAGCLGYIPSVLQFTPRAAFRFVGVVTRVAEAWIWVTEVELGLCLIKTGLMGQNGSTRGMTRLAAANGGELERRRRFWTLNVDRRNQASGTVSVNGATISQPNLGWVSRSVLWPKSCFRPNSVWVSKQSWVPFLGSGSMWFRIWDPGGWSQLNLVVLAWIIRRNFNFLSNSAYLLCPSFVIIIGFAYNK